VPETNVRVVGSGYTTLEYAGRPIAYLDNFVDSGQRSFAGPGGGGVEPIIPLGAQRPIEIVTARVLGPGTITAGIIELWNAPIWYQLSGLAGRRTLIDLWAALRASPNPVTCRTLINPPNSPRRGKVFHGCVITAIDDGETVAIGTLSVTKNIQITYTHHTAL
jgi:hypothetical protein